MPSTIRLHRVLHGTPERVFRAFTDPDAMAKWLPPYGFTGKVHHVDLKIGGAHKMSFTNMTSGKSHSFGGKYLEIRRNELIRYTDKFDDPNLPGEMQVTVTMKKVSCGTELTVVQEGVPDVIPAETCYLGWQESLAQLANLVNLEIPD
ncbi:MAG TPA: SRPBCC family protein [Burkholderiales bacterium]|nr:SRPBCC family protein [Burkholderiales bacterium]